ncbi:MAG: gamma-glutamyltransferase [Thermomicrobiales bacterium]|nr:gamma-glutamyltransferase [Thermomicrobiales bacterium]
MTLGFPGPRDAAQAASCDTRRISPTLARNGMIASQHPLVSATGLRVLAAGGNAVDAAVAAALVGTVVMPARCGVGGDLFAIVARPDAGGRWGADDLLAFHGSGNSPAGATLEYMTEHGQDAADGSRVMAQHGPLSPAVPGFVDGCFALLDRYGTKSFAELAEPAIGYAAKGFPISPAEAGTIAELADELRAYPTTAAIFLPNGRPPRPGEILRQRDLARTLATVARGGPDAFYRGPIAREVGDFLAANGGALTADDFAAHETDVTAPLQTTYRDYTIYETALPTQGFVVLEALNICEQAPMTALGLSSAAGVHTEVSALRLAFADRLAYAGDPRHLDCPMDTLLSKAWAADRYAQIPADRLVAAEAGVLAASDTTSLVAVDRDGLMISLIFTVSDAYGSYVVAGDTGMILTNRAGHCFSLEPNHPNIYAPGKRTMHTLNCYLIADNDGTPVLVGGTPGGDYQPQWNLQTITGLIDGGLDVQAAAEQPRWQMGPATYPAERCEPFYLTVEERLGDETIARLEAMGYPIQRVGAWGAGGSVQAIARDPETGILAGGSDPRAEGQAIGL